jgi:hypothetical protein
LDFLHLAGRRIEQYAAFLVFNFGVRRGLTFLRVGGSQHDLFSAGTLTFSEGQKEGQYGFNDDCAADAARRTKAV